LINKISSKSKQIAMYKIYHVSVTCTHR